MLPEILTFLKEQRVDIQQAIYDSANECKGKTKRVETIVLNNSKSAPTVGPIFLKPFCDVIKKLDLQIAELEKVALKNE